MRKLMPGLALLAAMGLCESSWAAPAGIDPQILSQCEGCHGPHGDSKSDRIPRLNGQHSAYIVLRLKQFLDPTRGSPHATNQMWERAGTLGNRTTASLANYFAIQTPTPAAPKGALAQKGETIYRLGSGSQVPACQSCHGAQGAGRGVVPRLAGQHGEYLSQQMDFLMLGLRVSAPMNRHAWHLSAEQIAALTAYLAND